ncbi:MAG: lysophospholipid acyltransferase family protein [Rhodobacteraceae bacterium]|nr:lysophospholipid acyltransferase family protein [Paracoccaceae bacterium]
MSVFYDYLVYLSLRSMLLGMRLIPYEKRVIISGKTMEKVIAPLTDMNQRVHNNLKLIFPDMNSDARENITKGVINNFGRLFCENYSGKEFTNRANMYSIRGSGFEELRQAQKEKQPVFLVSGHFGNFEAVRAYLTMKGYVVSGVYQPMSNTFFNEHYVKNIKKKGAPLFSTKKKGTLKMIRHLKKGGIVSLLNDQYASQGEDVEFLGVPTKTRIGVGQLAIKYNALVIPCYGIRKEDGLNFEIVLESSIPLTDPTTVTQELNHSLESMVLNYPEQWYWIHRRWKNLSGG